MENASEGSRDLSGYNGKFYAYRMGQQAKYRLQSNIVTRESLPYEQLVKYTRELHDLRPKWTQARRRIVSTKELLIHTTEHADFTSLYDFKGRIVNESYFSKRISDLDARIARCDELEDQTKSLTSLIFSLATMRDTKKTIEETTAANALTMSVRRVTVLGFIYLPLNLASVRLSLNNPADLC